MNFHLKLLLLFIPITSFAQKKSEIIQFSFTTADEMTMELCRDTLKNALIFRYGNGLNPELEVADDLNDDEEIFTYTYYFRGGGAGNSGLDFNNVSFIYDKHRYTIYSEYYTEDDDSKIGMRIVDLESNKELEIEGQKESVRGNLVDFRFNALIPILDERMNVNQLPF